MVHALLAEGATCREVCATLGIGHSYFYSLKADPEGLGEAARKLRYRGTCKACGRSTTGSNGLDAPSYCSHCAPAHYHTRWTREGIIFALQEIARLTGEVPKAKAAFTGGYNDLPLELQGRIGGVGTTAQKLFGSWNNAIAAAGMTPRKMGHREHAQRRLR